MGAKDTSLQVRQIDLGQFFQKTVLFMWLYNHYITMVIGKKKGARKRAPPTPTERLTVGTGRFTGRKRSGPNGAQYGPGAPPRL